MAATLSLHDLCIPESKKPFLTAPTVYTLPGGAPWTVATDGHAMFCQRGTIHGCREAEPTDTGPSDSPLAMLLRLSSVPLGDLIDVAALRAWAGEYNPWVSCQECDGEGERYCQECENHGRCCECKGQGGWGGDVRPGSVRGFTFDRNLLAKFLRYWTEATEANFQPEWHRRDSTRMAALVGERQALILCGLDPACQRETIVPFEEANHGE